MAGAILVGAGQSQRMGGVDKTIAPLAGRPVAAWALSAFVGCDRISAIVLVSGERNHEPLAALAAEAGGKVVGVVPGGATRSDSVRAGLDCLTQQAEVDLVSVHDMARPLITAPDIERGLALAAEHGAAIAGAPVTDTIKTVDDSEMIQSTLDRSALRAAQTPQTFRLELLQRAHRGGVRDASDDAMLVETLAEPVVVYACVGLNLKITTPEDLRIAQALLAARAEGSGL